MKKTLIVGVAIALAPAFALAADKTKKMGDKPASSLSGSSDQFRALDRNRDGFLSQDEWKGQNLPFSTLDKNGDGKISAQEFEDHHKGAAGPAGPAGIPGEVGKSHTQSTGSPSSSAPSTSPPSSNAPSPTPGETKK
jgi:hypothetical protein